MAEPTATIVMAAHNEAAVIERTLRAFLPQSAPGEFQVLVVCNGCSDGTAEAARSAGEQTGRPVEVREIPVASKIAALRKAEDEPVVQRADVRIYLDADVLVDVTTLRNVRDAVAGDMPRLGVVRGEVDAAGSSGLVRAYYAVWSARQHAVPDGSGAGIFAVNRAGAARISQWPDVLSDDGFVARQFAASERVVAAGRSVIRAPRTVSALVRRRARIVNGNRELDIRWPRTAAEPPAVRRLVLDRRVSLVHAGVFVTLTIAARALAAWRRWRGRAAMWSADDTSRRAY